MKGMALALLLAIFVAGTAFALESGPSNPVGFFTISLDHTGGGTVYYLVSFPTLPTDSTLGNTIGTQVFAGNLSRATTVYWMDNRTQGYVYAYLATGGVWNANGVTCLESRKGYYIKITSFAASQVYNVVVAGNVRTVNWNMDSLFVGWNMIGSVFAASVPLTSAALVSGGTRLIGGNLSRADRIYRLNAAGGYEYSYLDGTSTWQQGGTYTPPFTSLDPGTGYFIVKTTFHPTAFAWPDYPVPASTSSSSSDSYVSNPAPATRVIATSPVNYNSASVGKPVVTSPTAVTVTPAATRISSDVVPVKAKTTTSSSTKSK